MVRVGRCKLVSLLTKFLLALSKRLGVDIGTSCYLGPLTSFNLIFFFFFWCGIAS